MYNIKWDGLSNAACMSYWQIWRLGWLSFFSVTTIMFLVAELEDTVRIEPKHFDKSDNEAITEVLNQKFANKVGASRQRAKGRERKLIHSTRSFPMWDSAFVYTTFSKLVQGLFSMVTVAVISKVR